MTIIPIQQVAFGDGVVALATDGPLRGRHRIEPNESIYWQTVNGDMLYLKNDSKAPIDFDVLPAADYGH